jgi:hypothetical protein
MLHRFLFLLLFLSLFLAGCGKEENNDATLLAATKTKIQGTWIFSSRLNQYFNGSGTLLFFQFQDSEIVKAKFADNDLEYTFTTSNPDRLYTYSISLDGNKTLLSTFLDGKLQGQYELAFSVSGEMVWVGDAIGNFYYTKDGIHHPASQYKRTLTFIRQ